MRIRPIPGSTYSYRTIVERLDLVDVPYLQIHLSGRRTVIQTAHVRQEDLLTITGFGETLWIYVRTTSEWIPVFTAVSGKNPESLAAMVDVVTVRDPDFDNSITWVTPKGFPRQYPA